MVVFLLPCMHVGGYSFPSSVDEKEKGRDEKTRERKK